MSPLKLSTRDLLRATDYFSKDRLIGSGGYGKVHSGTIHGIRVAVKSMDKEKISENPSTLQSVIDAYDKEIELLSACDNENIISLVGYCKYQDTRFLAYELMPNGSLSDYLLKRENNNYVYPRLTTIQRLKILKGAAKGIQYLHSGPVKDWYGNPDNIIHGDLKADNILLDDDLVPKIADFGLSKPRPVGHMSSKMDTTHPIGTPGYTAPECNKPNYKPSRTVDIYAFGVVILEVLCEKPGWKNLIVEAIVLTVRGELKKFIPEHVKEDIDSHCLRMCEELISDCLENETDKRPTISQVCRRLKSALKVQKVQVTYSLVDGSRNANANGGLETKLERVDHYNFPHYSNETLYYSE